MEEAKKKKKHIDRVIYVPDTLKVLRPSTDLCFNEFDALGEDDDNVNFIHSEIPMKHAKRFGVRSIRQQMLAEADAFEEWGQDEPLTRRLKVLLEEGYVDGFAVGKELFQNADDAGARKMYILYDERQNESLRANLISETLAECQGPALWVYNDALFSEEDLIAITKLNGGTKQFDTTKIGKFGLGFCSVYNLTDVPSFISGENFVMFDPHTTFLGKALPGKSPGIRINFSKVKNLQVLGRMKHQFDVFEGVFDCQMNQENPSSNGTLFRLPLRTRGYNISDKVYTKCEMVDLLRKIVQMAPNMFLFNQHITELKIFHLNDNENISNMQLIHHVVKREANFGPTDLHRPILIESSCRKKAGTLQQNAIKCVQKVTIATDCFVNENIYMEGKNQSSVSNWIVSWASGTDSETMMISEKEKGALPLGAVAALIAEDCADADCERNRSWPLVDMSFAPKCFFQKGHYFFYLPLPIECSFPFHINAQFSVTSDRRHFRSLSEDDKDSSFGKWNDCIMSDMIVDALLQLLAHNSSNNPYVLWPLKSNGSLEPTLVESFYKKIVNHENECFIFRVADKLTSLSKVKFLHPKVRKDEVFGDVIFEMLDYLMTGELLVDIPVDIYERLLEVNEEIIMSKTVTAKMFALTYFLPNIKRLQKDHENLQNKVMAFILNLPSDSEIEKMISCTACIPTYPDNVLRAPAGLVDPKSVVGKMFSKNDGYFPSALFTEYIPRLKQLGMMFENIRDELLVERANTVTSLYESCCLCASERSVFVCNYVKSHISEIENKTSLKEALQNCRFFVVQNKPHDWEYIWHGVSGGCDQILCNEHTNTKTPVVLACPIQMFTTESKHLVSCHSFVVHETYALCTRTTEYLGIHQLQSNNETDIKHVLKQLKMMVVFSGNKMTYKTQRALKDVYSFIEQACSISDAHQEIIAEYLFSENTILAGNVFVNPLNIVRSCYEIDCKPYIYTVKETTLSDNPTLCNVLQIKTSCKINQLISILDNINKLKEGTSLNDVEFLQCVNLLNCIARIITKEGFIFDEILKNEGEIYVPDTNMIMQPSHKLCFDDYDSIPKSDDMIYAHGDVSKNTAKAVGVRKKKIKHFEENSVDIEDMEYFYPSEPLITRIHRLIEGYPLGVELLKELLQNADDAGGTEVCFVLDYESHPDTNLLSKTMRPIQGPSLCVYNNSAFTEADLIGIQSLGIGSKGDDPYQTGRYGVGFNVVYNITDTPTFLTIGEDLKTLCYFDPLAETIPGINQNKPGIRLTNLENYRKHHPNLFSGFHESHFFKSGKGTMFRLPLRTKQSSISSKVVTVDIVQTLLKEFGQYMTIILLFLKNLTKISIVEHRHGDYTCLSSVTKTVDDDSVAAVLEFSVKYGDLCKTFKQSKELITQFQQHVSSFRITVLHEENGKPVSKKAYTIVQALGFRQTLPVLLKEEILRGSLALLPVGGVAYNEQQERSINDHDNVFCFLPLPLKSGLPVYVHGYFALDHETRRSLWNSSDESKCAKTLWNKCLIEDVISTAYVRLIGILKDLFTGNCIGQDLSANTVLPRVDKVVTVYPLKSKVNGAHWEWLVKGVFYQLESEKHDYLPSFRKEVVHSFSSFMVPHRSVLLRLKWLSVQPNDHFFPTFFKEDLCDSDNDHHLHNLLMEIGIKIVSLNKRVRESMEFAGVQCRELTPKEVIDFLQSFCNANVTDRCKIETGIEVTKSVVCSIDNFARLVNYIAKDKPYFQMNIDQIPVVVSEDNIICCLKTSTSMFITKYSQLFLNKRDLFLHETLLSCFQTFCDKHEKLTSFTLKDFASLARLEECVPKAPGRVKIEQEFIKWLKMFWVFFQECLNNSPKDKSDHVTEIESVSALSEALREIEEFSIVPICEPVSKETSLCSSKEIPKLLNAESFQTSLQSAFMKLNIPQLDAMLKAQSWLPVFNRKQDAFELLNTVIPNGNAPDAVLNSLKLNSEVINNAEISNDDAITILGYFNDCLKNSNIPDISGLRHLRLFISAGNERVAISAFKSAFIIPYVMPYQGLHTIMHKSDILLLRTDVRLTTLMTALRMTEESLPDVYIQCIIPNQKQMSREDFYHHVKFLAGYINNNILSVPKCQDIVASLSKADFIETASKSFVRVSQLFDHQNEIFREMCCPGDFLPLELQSYIGGVRDLMLKLGLQSKLTISLYERFAGEIEHTANRVLNEQVEKQSCKLLQSLINEDADFFKHKSFEYLTNIRFVTPKKVKRKLQKLHPQFKSPGLVTLSECVTNSNSYICWTTCSIFPLKPAQGFVLQQLRIQTMPPPNKWTEHCRQIGIRFHKLLSFNPSQVDMEMIQQVLVAIYESVHEYGTRAKSLIETPLVLFHDSCLLVPAKNIILECSQSDEIPPLLMKAPVCFGSHFRSFISLGARLKPCHQDYADILDILPHEVKLNPKEWHDANLAETLFFRYVLMCKEVQLQNLHLLCTDHTIRRANCLIVNDKQQYIKRLHEKAKHMLFATKDFSEIHEQFGKLSTIVRPHLLSELVVEEIDLTNMQIISGSQKAVKIKAYLQSSMFKNSLVRIARNDYLLTKKKWDRSYEVKLCNIMEEIKINEVTNMFTFLKVFNIENGVKANTATVIAGTKQNQSVHVHEDENSVISINFSRHHSSWLDWFRSEVSYILQKHVGGHRHLLSRILNYKLDSDDLLKILSESDIALYKSELCKHVEYCDVPVPGDFVPKTYHKFLSNGYGVIPEHDYEFIALLVEDPAFHENEDETDTSATYIYVHVKRRNPATAHELPLLQEYEIESGEENRRMVKAFLLYRFIREESTNVSKERSVVLNNRVTKESITIEAEPSLTEVCKEIRQILQESLKLTESERKHVIKRLMFKWHPDKNPDRVQMATKVFQYIRQCVHLMEQGRSIPEFRDDNVDATDAPERGYRGSDSHNWYDRYWRKQRENYSDDEWFFTPRSSGTSSGRTSSGPSSSGFTSSSGGFSYRHEETPPYRFPAEAKRWQRQAQADLEEATRTFNNNGYPNWICYKAHQAAEKALKSAWYAKDANKVGNIKNSHELTAIATGLDDQLVSLAGQISAITGHHTRMRYPDMVHGSIPAEAYSREESLKVVELAREIIDRVQSHFLT